jgi:hypothetical protein
VWRDQGRKIPLVSTHKDLYWRAKCPALRVGELDNVGLRVRQGSGQRRAMEHGRLTWDSWASISTSRFSNTAVLHQCSLQPKSHSLNTINTLYSLSAYCPYNNPTFLFWRAALIGKP